MYRVQHILDKKKPAPVITIDPDASVFDAAKLNGRCRLTE